MKVCSCISCSYGVISGVVQSLTYGPELYTLVADTLVQIFSLPHWVFADDFKLLLILPVHSRAIIKVVVNKIVQCSNERLMLLIIEESGVMLCGVKQPNYIYNIHDRSITVFESFKDLRILRFSNGLRNGQCQDAANKVSKDIWRHPAYFSNEVASFVMACLLWLHPVFV